MKIIAIESLSLTSEKLEYISSALFAAGHEFVHYNDKVLNQTILAERAKNAEIIITVTSPISEQFVLACPDLKLIAVAFTGYEHIDIAACRKKGIEVCNVPAYSVHAVSEMVIGLAVSLLRKFKPMEMHLRNGKDKGAFLGSELFGKTIGIIGTGNIGMATANLFRAFGCKIIAHSRSERKEAIDAGIRYVSLETLLSHSDIVSIHTPLNEMTSHLIGSNEIALMKPTAILINAARGSIVDYGAVANALNKNLLGGAGIDVYESEPPIAANHALMGCPNIMLLPHIGYATKEAIEKRANVSLQNILQWIAGTPENIVGSID